MAHVRHVPVGAWFNATGVKDLTEAWVSSFWPSVGFATLGMAVGLFLRSAVFAVIVGLAYLIAVENIVGRVLPPLNRWLPGQLLLGVGQGGNATTTFARAVLVSAIYLVAIALVRRPHLQAARRHSLTTWARLRPAGAGPSVLHDT